MHDTRQKGSFVISHPSRLRSHTLPRLAEERKRQHNEQRAAMTLRHFLAQKARTVRCREGGGARRWILSRAFVVQGPWLVPELGTFFSKIEHPSVHWNFTLILKRIFIGFSWKTQWYLSKILKHFTIFTHQFLLVAGLPPTHVGRSVPRRTFFCAGSDPSGQGGARLVHGPTGENGLSV